MNLTELSIITLYFAILLFPIAGVAFGIFYINRRDALTSEDQAPKTE